MSAKCNSFAVYALVLALGVNLGSVSSPLCV